MLLLVPQHFAYSCPVSLRVHSKSVHAKRSAKAQILYKAFPCSKAFDLYARTNIECCDAAVKRRDVGLKCACAAIDLHFVIGREIADGNATTESSLER